LKWCRVHRRLGEITLTPTIKDEFRAGAWFIRVAAFVRDRDGRVTGVRLGVGRARNLWFDRQARTPPAPRLPY
jgi:hypothetical protein